MGLQIAWGPLGVGFLIWCYRRLENRFRDTTDFFLTTTIVQHT